MLWVLLSTWALRLVLSLQRLHESLNPWPESMLGDTGATRAPIAGSPPLAPAHIHKDQQITPDCLRFQPPVLLNPRNSLLAAQRPEELGNGNLPAGSPYARGS